MTIVTLNMYHATALAAVVLLVGRFMVSRIQLLSKYCIPAPIVGGVLYAILHCILYVNGIAGIVFDDTLQKFFMTIFFTSVGFMASFYVLKKGGIQVIIFLAVILGLVVLQDVLGCLLATLFQLDPRIGLCVGSISMIGGHGTAGSLGFLVEDLGVPGAGSVAMAAATFGLVAGSLLGGPVGRARIERHHLSSNECIDQNDVEQEITQNVENERFLNTAIYFAFAIGLGEIVSNFFVSIGLTFPSYIGAMLVAVVIRNIGDWRKLDVPMIEINALGNLSLNLYLAMALMSLQLWQLVDLALPMVVMLLGQAILLALYAYFVIFRVMGSDYEAAVMSSAACGFGMGATPNAMANMQAISKLYGPAPRAFLVVPLVGSLFIDFFNSLIIAGFLNFL